MHSLSPLGSALNISESAWRPLAQHDDYGGCTGKFEESKRRRA